MTTYYAKATGGSDAADGLTLATAKTLTGATSACAASGDTIMIAAGTYLNPTLPAKTISYQSYTLPTAVTPPGWINPDPALAIRNVIFKGSTTAVGAADCHFHGIHFKFDKWANTMLGEQLSVPGGAIFVQGVGTHAPIFNQCEFSWGYGPNQDPFDPTTANEYPEFQSGAFANEGHSAVGKGDPYQSWWQIRDDGLVGSSPSYQPTPDKVTGLVGTPNGRAYNTIANGPIGFKSLANQRPPQMYECYFHDLAGGVAYSHATGPFVLDNCRFLRIYRDHLAGAIGQYETTIAPNSGLQVSRCLFDSPFGRFDDSGNAHSDVIQNFNNSPISTPSQPVLIPNIRLERNFMLIREGFRGSGQFMFFQGAQSHLHDLYGAVYVSPLVRDNISIQLDGAVGVTFSYAFDGDFTNNQFLHVPNVGASGNLQIESTVHPTWNGGFGGTPRVAYNMTEGGGSVLGGQFNDNVAVGMNFAAIPFAAAVTGPLLPPTAQAHEYYAAMRPKAAYAGKGPRFNTLEEFLNSPLVDTDVVPFVAYRSKQLQSLHSPMTSTASTIRGPIGGTVDVSVNLGEFQIESVTGSVITPWRSAALTAVPVKSLLRLRHNSADTFGTVTNQQVTLTSAYHTPKVYSFSSTTQANTPWPTLRLSPSAPVDALIFNGVIAEDHVDNNKHTVALWFKPAGIPSSSTQYIIGSSSGSGHPIRAAFLPTGKIRITGRDPTTASVFTQYDSSNAITVGHEYLLIISIDLSLGSDGVTAKGWNMTDGISHLEWGTAAGVVDTKLSLSVSTKHGISGVTGAAGFDFDYLFLHPRKFMNAKLPETAQAFSKAFIGPRGEGPFGSIPAIFVAGPASLVDAAGGSNWGTVGPVVRGAAGFITDVDSPVPAFPPQLIIDASVQEQSPFYDGEPINILLQPRGYAGAHTITATSNKAGAWSNNTTTVAAGVNGATITFTPSEPGKHVLNFTNNIGYINPDPIEILIRDPNASFIIPGTTVKLTKSQAATLKIVTDNDEYATDLGPISLKWARLGYNVGVQDSLDIKVNVDDSKAADYIVANDTDLNLAIAALATSGGIIALDPAGTFASGRTISNIQPTSKLTIKGASAIVRTPLRTITLSNCKNIRLENLITGEDVYTETHCVRGSTGSTPCENIELVNNEMYGASLEAWRNLQETFPTAPTRRSGITGNFNNLTVIGNYIHDVGSAIKPSTITGALIVGNNIGKNIYEDFISYGDNFSSSHIYGNFATQFIGRGSDQAGLGPHCDYHQIASTTSNTYMGSILFEGNVYVAGEARGSAQVYFGPSGSNGSRIRARVLDNLSIVRDSEQQTPGTGGNEGSLCSRWITVRELPGVYTGTNLSRFDTSNIAESNASAFVDSIGESFSGANGTVRANNYLLPNTLVAYEAAFEGPFTGDLPTTRDGWVARYTPKTTGPLAYMRGVYNFTTQTRNIPHRTIINLLPATDLVPGSVYETAAMLVMSSQNSNTITVPVGVRYRKATTAAGLTSAIYTSAPGIVNDNEFIQLEKTVSSSPSTPVYLSVTLGGNTYSVTLTTASIATFATVSNQDAAWSRLNTAPPSESNRKKLVISLRSKLNTMAAFEYLFSGAAAGNSTRLMLAGGPKLSIRLVSSGTLSATSVDNLDSLWHTDIFTLDLTQTISGGTFKWIRDGSIVPVTISSETLTGTAVFNPSTIFSDASGNMGLFKAADGSNGNVDGSVAYLWIDYGDATYNIPDFTDPVNFSKWSADNIGLSNGAGPTGTSPKFFFYGQVSDWNDAAGIKNKGSLGDTYALVKQAGTYV